MTQQVVKCHVSFIATNDHTDTSSFDVYFEATGSDTTLPFGGTGDTPQGIMQSFITGAHGAAALDVYLSPDLSRATNAVSMEWTDITAHLDGSNAGSPFRTDVFTLAASSTNQALPPGCAVCVSYRRGYGADIEHGPIVSLPSDDSAIDQGAPATHLGASRPRARDRGRFFLGPFNLNAIGLNNGLLDSTFVSNLTASLVYLFTEHNPNLPDQFSVVQWSRRNASVGGVGFYALSEAMSYQRRRADENLARVHTWVSV